MDPSTPIMNSEQYRATFGPLHCMHPDTLAAAVWIAGMGKTQVRKRSHLPRVLRLVPLEVVLQHCQQPRRRLPLLVPADGVVLDCRRLGGCRAIVGVTVRLRVR